MLPLPSVIAFVPPLVVRLGAVPPVVGRVMLCGANVIPVRVGRSSLAPWPKSLCPSWSATPPV